MLLSQVRPPLPPFEGATTTIGDTITGTIDDNIGNGQPDAQYPNGPCGSEAPAVANDNGTRRVRITPEPENQPRRVDAFEPNNNDNFALFREDDSDDDDISIS